MRDMTKMATESNKRVPGASFGTVVDKSTIASDANNAMVFESGGEEFVDMGVGQMRVNGAYHSIIIVEADEFEIAGVLFFRDFIDACYYQAADIRSTENQSLCQLFEELFRRTRNAISLFHEDLQRGRLDTDYDLSDELRVIGRPIFDCVIAELSRILPSATEFHLAYLFKLREDMRVGLSETNSILLKRRTVTSPVIQRTLAHATITVLSQLFELEKSYCKQTNLPFNPADEGRFLNDIAA
jgi:hypothetical protein